MRMQRDTESAEQPAAADTNAAPSNDTGLAVTTTTEAGKSVADKIEQKVMEQIQNCKNINIII